MAIEIKDIEHLATLARVEISDHEKEGLRHDIEEILSFVSQIKEVAGGESTLEVGMLHNVLRDDRTPHEVGMFTEDLLSVAPVREGDKVVVKKILQ